uniref:U1-type domain-containing protein n=1 Tax=Caenorhabditis japonica TaxID=281687 RepID=A0A8R1HXM0_CAEJA
MSLNPLIAKQKPNGNIQCLVCNTELKPKIWTAHVNGKKHRESIERLKSASVQKRGKEASRNGADEPPSKKQKEAPREGPISLPTDFYDEESTSSRKERNTSTIPNSSALIEGVPAGFFDDKRLDIKTQETQEKNAELNAEYERWKEEIGEEQTEQEEKKEKREAAVQRSLELERIDEQMAALKKLNYMEIQKEKRLNQAKERRTRREREAMEEEEDDDGGEDIALDELDWRAKNIFS